MADEKKTEFVVTDRRRFAPEGELRTDAPVVEEEKPAAPPQAPPTPSAVHQKTEAQAAPEAEPAESEEMPPPPTAEEQHEQDQAYKASGKKLEEMIEKRTGKVASPVPEMTFEAVIESFYMSALIQLGLFRQEGQQQTGVDLIGARQTIDSLALLQEKTKGNLNDKEQHLLQNVLFELRMLWIERTNAIANAPLPAVGPGIVGAPPPGGIKK